VHVTRYKPASFLQKSAYRRMFVTDIAKLATNIRHDMKQIFKLKKGEIVFDEDKIIIKDDAKKQKWMLSLILCFATIYAIETFLKYFKTGDNFDFWFGLIVGSVGILVLVIWLLRSVRSEIPLIEVKSLKLNQRFNNEFLDINLKNNRLRRVSQVENIEELDKFIETNIRPKLN
jgi:hypothetical protein